MSNRTRPADPSCNMDSHLAGLDSSTKQQAEDEISDETK